MTHAGSTTDYDAVVVGGGPTGATTAGLLAQAGHRVLVLERERFPRFHIGESMITGMLSVIEQLGLTERLDAMGFERKYGISLVWGRERGLWSVSFREAGAYEYSYHVHRDRFDELLLDRAAELGCVVEQEATVREAIVVDGRVTGVRYTKDGELREATARIVVDASGQARTIARRFTEVDWNGQLRNLAIGRYYTGCKRMEGDAHGNIMVEKVGNDDGWFWGIPLGESLLSVGYVAPTEDIRLEGLDHAELFEKKLAQTTYMRDLLAPGTPSSDFRTSRDWSYMSREFYGPGWVTVGDASCFIDPLLSSGVCLGMLCAVPLAQAIGIYLKDPGQEERVFSRYAAGSRDFAEAILDYVLFFYDQQRDREDYFERAAAIANSEVFRSPRKGFVALISGIAGMGPIFTMEETGTSETGTSEAGVSAADVPSAGEALAAPGGL
ncbi:NAD(P)/FAD-dependent oxidoreductase [Streptomyces sp. NPDC008313]|uniref:NAD(P)/FAD-dependent oxidoreductase n=1 Tax=Streptomyces sp. NPDC008313 TaxID=3364826 RepID=UPI0036F19367